ncbi:hypothetical protein B0T14DRAFT_559045 [Immersiella caudata]|uniref:NACHT domain-containing protein n=1 Tax=Immersiella caudata TaxID=314043 RepID=A0AA39XCM7_9PEZI|nr:hypothetical protein B0T14DRAFT_559045 [Immersiella caudata]
MDPLTCLSIVSSAAQLTDFIFRLLHCTRSIYQSGTGHEDSMASIEGVMASLIELNRDVSTTIERRLLDQGSNASSRDDGPRGDEPSRRIIATAQECSATATQLIRLLGSLKADKATLWKSFRSALRVMMNKEEVERLSSTVLRLQGNLIAHMQFELLESQSDLSTSVRKLNSWSQGCDSNFGRLVDKATQDVKAYFSLHIRPLEEQIEEILDSKVFAKQALPVVREALMDHMPPLSQRIADLIPHATAAMEGMEFLRKLSFGEIRTRHETIPDAHATTFEWVFKNRTPDGLHDIHFAQWLRAGRGMYWVRGKPGSGKSTLMKFLRQHKETNANLCQWSPQEKLVTSNHFFWNAGSALQKSQEGLFRTLLFDILLQWPEMIPEVQGLLSDATDPYNPWSATALSRAIQFVISRGLPVRFCFFIDGLDEYEGDHVKLIDVLKLLASSPNIKICASSRPWACFLEAFGNDAQTSLKLEELTASDIRRFVNDRIGGNSHFQRYSNNAEYSALVDEVVSRANGVFLWVALVVKSLLEGFTYSDRIKDLRRRLETLPTDLETFFSHMLRSVDSFYQQQSAQIFLFATEAVDELPVILYSLADEIDGDASRIVEVRNDLTLQTIEEDAEEMTRRLDGRTKGLLEVLHVPESGSRAAVSHPHARYRVGFLHRTVRDWLQAENVREAFRKQAGSDFDASLSLAQASTGFLRLLMTAYPTAMSEKSGAWLDRELAIIVFYIGRIAPSASETHGSELMRTLLRLVSSFMQSHMRDSALDGKRYVLLLLAVRYRLLWYVRTAEPILLTTTKRAELLASALNLIPGSASPGHACMGVSIDIVRLLLTEPGWCTNPNTAQIPGGFLWERFLHNLQEGREIFGLEHPELVELVAVMVSAGARLKGATPECTRWMRTHLFTPDDWDYILNSQPQNSARLASSFSSSPTVEEKIVERARQKREGSKGARGPKSSSDGTGSSCSSLGDTRKKKKKKSSMTLWPWK